MLDDIGKAAGVKGVTVVHGIAITTSLRGERLVRRSSGSVGGSNPSHHEKVSIASAFAEAAADKSSLQRKIALQFCRELLAMTGSDGLEHVRF
ncbi:hypothetical protein [Bradyrhizobium sp. 2S1]|uniref:hypothetical protein n=1 Tax=Bradyrhizobium sp. 2S1 TaxID=1404429 RepID=UPI001407730C|nr:hypothetical protein [Bradyrhizobium sp. 2S1]MCK7672906.1 hypothetical protein [Bradyrhizobium sp. 2S1]